MAWKTLAIDESAFTQLMQLFTGVPVLNSQFTAIAVSSCIAAYASNQWKKVLGRATKGGGWYSYPHICMIQSSSSMMKTYNVIMACLTVDRLNVCFTVDRRHVCADR